ncbi:RecX family transcriptional regulator [Gemella sp. GH3]|uniref:RecX family transcriptional regulator n=1 Tax=unclassified Gemella TaxID=2624949 RepID=UPI0015CF840E|nr:MULTISPECIES: RecX family transcriptional regulator [unclassified Gemella]MBF0714332.1 RecX family transcriptional regulator [Gemella sp. GH3.1]NYS51284.1 RecX family transcriptional regulator [Gemella sp. GH3]
MEIINITKLKKKYKIDFSDGKYIYLSENTVLKYNIIKKGLLSETVLREAQVFEGKEQAFTKALNYLSYGMKSEYEIKEYLIKKEFSLGQIDYAIPKLKEFNYIRDDEYAKSYSRDYFLLKKKGPSYIRKNLEKKKVPSEYIDVAIKEICTNEKMIDVVYGIIEKEYNKKNEPKTKKIQKITNKLYTNGYSFDIINSVFKIYLENHEDTGSDNRIISKYYQKAYNKFSKKYDDNYTLKNKIIEKLIRDGFSYGDIKDYLEEIDF